MNGHDNILNSTLAATNENPFTAFLQEIAEIDSVATLALEYIQISNDCVGGQSRFEVKGPISNMLQAVSKINQFIVLNQDFLSGNVSYIELLQEFIVVTIEKVSHEITLMGELGKLLVQTLTNVDALQHKEKGLRISLDALTVLYPEIHACIEFADNYELGSAIGLVKPLDKENQELYSKLHLIKRFLSNQGINLDKALLKHLGDTLTLCQVRIKNRDSRHVENTYLLLNGISKNLESLKNGQAISVSDYYEFL